MAIAARAAGDAANLGGRAPSSALVTADVFFSRAVAEKGGAVRKALLSGFQIERSTLRLVKRAFVPIDASISGLPECLRPVRACYARRQCLNAQDHGAVQAAGKKPVKKGGAGATYGR